MCALQIGRALGRSIAIQESGATKSEGKSAQLRARQVPRAIWRTNCGGESVSILIAAPPLPGSADGGAY